jgi:O-antigen ligase
LATELNPPLPPENYLEATLPVERSAFLLKVGRLINRVIFGSLLALIVVVAVPYGTVEPWWEAFFECAIFILTALWIVEGLLLGRWNISERALFVPLLLLVGFALVQAIPYDRVPEQEAYWYAISADPFGTLRFALKMTALILAGALLLSHLTSRKRLRALILTITLVALASALFGMLRQTAQRDADGFLLPYLPLGAGYGQFINTNHFAYLMELSFGLPLSLLLARNRDREKWLLFAGLATPLLLALVLANSRGGLLGLCGQLLFIILFANQSRRDAHDAPPKAFSFARISQAGWFRPVMGAFLIVILLIGITWVGGDPLMNKLEAVAGEVSAVGDASREGTRRIDMWNATWQMIAENPLFGTGFGGYAMAITKYHAASGKLIPQQAHNEYIEILASGGIVGAGLWLWFLFLCIRRANQSLLMTRSARQRAVCIGALAGIVAVAVHSFVDFGLHITINALVCTALIVIVMATPTLAKSGEA